MRILKVLPIAALVLSGTQLFAGLTANVSKTFNVQPGGKLIVKTDGADVVVTTGAANVVNATVERRVRTSDKEEAREKFGKYRVDLRQEGNTVVVELKRKEKLSFEWGFGGASLQQRAVVTVPKSFHVDLSTSGGDISVADLDGQAIVKTSGGDISLGRTGGSVVASTSGGDIKITSSNGPAVLTTSGGDISAGDINGNLEARTSGGDIEIARATGSVIARSSGGDIDLREVTAAVKATTSGGDITAAYRSMPSGNVVMATSGGGIRVALPADSRFELDAETSGGDVDVDFPITIRSKTSRSLAGTVNGGGIKLDLSTSSGDVRVVKN